jgi:quinol monooxygenase YgiN
MLTLRSGALMLLAIFALVGGPVLAADDEPGSSLGARLNQKVKDGQPFELLVRIKLKPGTEAKFAAEAAKIAKATATEPGNERFVFYQHQEQPDTVILLEKWKNLDAFKAHQEAPHTVPWLAFTKEIGVEATIGILRPLQPAK